MKAVRSLLITLLLCPAFAADQPVVKARGAADAYPASKFQASFSLGASKLSKELVRKIFVSDVGRGYVVVEVAMYPAEGKTVDLQRSAFSLRVKGSNDSVHAAGPDEVASFLQKHPVSVRDVTVTPTTGVVYENYPDVYGNRQSGVATTAGVGVWVGDSHPTASTSKDRNVMETELRDKGLPDGSINKPVAGYLYFPFEKQSSGSYELQYTSTDSISILTLK